MALLLGDVGMDAYPFANRAPVIEYRHRPNRTVAIHAIVPAYAVFVGEDVLFGHSHVPRIDRRLRIVRMDGLGPTVTLIFLEFLPSEVPPARLLARHSALGIVGPDQATYRFDCRAETRLARPQLFLFPLALAHVAEYQHAADDLAVLAADRRGAIVDGSFGTVF